MLWTEQANLLLRKAHEDAVALTKLASDAVIMDAIVGFHAQPACEKGLKPVLAAHGIAYPKTHNLRVLRDLLTDAGVTPPADVDAALMLSPFGVLLRYDDPIEVDLNRPEAVRLVTAVLAWCDSQVATAS